MIPDPMQIGWRPVLAGLATLAIAGAAGWGIGGHMRFPPVRIVRAWLDRVILRVLRSSRWSVRAGAIFLNNTMVCAALILAGGLPGGAWAGVVVVGLSMGIAVRGLSEREPPTDEDAVSEAQRGADGWTKLGLILNLVEVPAICLTLGLAMGQLAAPNGLTAEHVWMIFAVWVIPSLAVAAAGESLWIGRLRPF